MQDTSTPFVISFLGDDPFAEVLESIYETATIRDKPVVVRRISGLDGIEGSHILFVAASERTRVSEVVTYVKGRAVLTVGDSDGFAERGIHINFFLRENRIAFQVNEQEIETSPLSVSYLLLRVADVVGSAR